MYAVCECVWLCACICIYTYIPHAYSASTNLQNLRQHASAVCQKPAFHLHHLSCKNSHPPLFTMARNANNRGHSPSRPIFTTVQLSFSLGMTDGERLLPPLIFTIIFHRLKPGSAVTETPAALPRNLKSSRVLWGTSRRWIYQRQAAHSSWLLGAKHGENIKPYSPNYM